MQYKDIDQYRSHLGSQEKYYAFLNSPSELQKRVMYGPNGVARKNHVKRCFRNVINALIQSAFYGAGENFNYPFTMEEG